MGFDLYGVKPQANKKYPPRYDEITMYGTGDHCGILFVIIAMDS